MMGRGVGLSDVGWLAQVVLYRNREIECTLADAISIESQRQASPKPFFHSISVIPRKGGAMRKYGVHFQTLISHVYVQDTCIL